MAPRRPHRDNGRQLVPVPTSHGDVWLDLLSYISKSSSRPWRLVREILVARLQAVPDMERTERYIELLKQYEHDGREHIPDTEVRLVLMPVIREALPKQFRCLPWIPEEVPTPSSRGGSAHTDEDRRDLEGIMSDEVQPRPVDDQPMSEVDSEAIYAALGVQNDPLAQILALREMYKVKASLAEVELWSLSSRANVAVKALLDNLATIDDRGKAPLVRKFSGIKAREIPRADVVAAITELMTDLGAAGSGKGSHGPNT